MDPELEREAARLTAQLREQQGPDPAAQARMWSGIEEQLPAGPPGGGGGGGGSGMGVAVAGVVAAAAVVALLLIPDRDVQPVATSEAPAPVAAVDTAAPPPEPVATAVTPAAVPVEEEAVEAEPVEPPEVVRAPRKPRPAKAEPTQEVETDEGLDLERELQGMRAIKTSRKNGDHQGALDALDRHRQEFPKSSFEAERSLLHVLLLCDLGREDKARDQAARFRKRWPKSHLAGRLPTECVGS